MNEKHVWAGVFFVLVVMFGLGLVSQFGSNTSGAAIGIDSIVTEKLSVQAVTGNCSGNYSGSGNWVINTSITCSNDIVNVTGDIIIQDNSDVDLRLTGKTPE